MSEPDSLSEALQSQVSFYKGELESVKNEIKSLITENTEMSRQLQTLIKKNKELENVLESHENDGEEIKNLRKQLTLLQKEKKSFVSLWQTSQNTIKNLENEMKTYENFYKSSALSSNLDEAKYEYSSIIKMLETKLATSMNEIKSKEELINLSGIENQEILNKMNDKEKLFLEHSIKLEEANVIIGKLEREIVKLKNELLLCKQNSEELLNSMEVCRQNSNVSAKKEYESRNKVIEALKIVDGSILERDAALEREKAAIEESARLSKRVTDVLNQSTIRIQREIDVAKQTFNDKLNDMLIHIQRLELELGEKNLELERAHREYVLLEERNSDTKKEKTSGSDEKENRILILEQKFEATFQQLLLSERRNIQIISEKENLQMDFDQLANNFHRDKRKREWEDKLHSNEINSLKIQITNLKESLNEAHQSIQKLQADLIFKEDLEESLTNDKLLITKEFEKHFKNQQKLNTKWRENVKEIIIKLEKRVEDLMKDIDRLRQENLQLRTR